MRCPLAFALSLLFLAPVAAQDLVAKTDAKSPEDERKAFKLPKGFEAQLIASEPDIQKPMQMAFDSKGRLWVTTSHLYPWAAKPGEGTDRLYILSDFDDKGKAKTIEIFDDKLNIPIGVLPLPDGKSVIVSEAGSILKLTDTDGDGKADKREVLFTGFGYKDTHGMTNSFTAMPDGWIYATHGFANESKVKGKDGHEISMSSGNTFRFKTDGSRIEIFTRGQVNPFGICVDPWGNLYTACCHSKPITQLIRGAYYDSFGKPHDGLGYAPHVVNHQHGSTGLCGLAWGAGPLFPKPWDGVMFLGNCVTNRINCDRIEWKGSTPVGVEMPDFLSTDDAWFRPVDLKFGPDGALYVSDFYNKIVGHYEVDLKHPGRDKSRGRVWRIVWTGAKRTEKPAEADQMTEINAMRKLAEQPKLSDGQRRAVIVALGGHARTARVAVDAMAAQPHADFVKPLLAFIPKIPGDDNHLRHAARIALKHSLNAEGGFRSTFADADFISTSVLADVGVAVGTPDALEALAGLFVEEKLDKASRVKVAEFVGRQDRPKLWDGLIRHNSSERREDQAEVLQNKLEIILALLRGERTGKAVKVDDPSSRTVSFVFHDLLEGTSPELLRLTARVLNEWLTAGHRLEFSQPRLAAMLEKQFGDAKEADARVDFADALLLVAPDAARPKLRAWATATGTPASARDRVFLKLLAKPTTTDSTAAIEVLKSAPYATALAIATGLAGDKFGGDLLLLAVKKGEAPVRLLQEKAVVDRLRSTKVKDVEARIAELTKGLPAPEKRIDDLIKRRGEGFRNFKSDPAKGKEIFAKNCAACHQVNNEGAKVGPQLDGVGIRGVDRLLEDTLDPSRNVDAAFKSTTLQLLDGRSLSGLAREEGAAYVLIDSLGKENRIAVKDVDQVVKSNLSAMPANVDAVIPEADYYHLLAFLLSQKAK